MAAVLPLGFDPFILDNVPAQFICTEVEKPCLDAEELHIPTVDLHGFFAGDPNETFAAARVVAEACEKYGLFQVVNHGVDAKILKQAHLCMDRYFQMPVSDKQKAKRKVGESFGYASSFTGRFASNLPWKETLSIRYVSSPTSSDALVEDYFHCMGEDFQHFG